MIVLAIGLSSSNLLAPGPVSMSDEGSLSASPTGPVVSQWDSASFWRVPGFGGPRHRTDAFLLANSRSAYWYIENETVGTFGLNYTLEQMATITATFEETILPRLHSAFGFEPLPPNDVDNNPNTTILISRDLGLFDYRNELPVSVDPYSNAREMIYVRYDENISNLLAMVAHEFTHLIGWNYDPSEAGWVSEGLAMVSERTTGFGTSLAPYYLANTSIGLFSGVSHGWADYGGWELFIQYLADQFGGWSLTRALTQDPLHGAAGIEDALSRLGIGMSFRSVFRDWTVANLVNNETSGSRRFQYTNVTGRASTSRVVGGFPWSADIVLENGGVEYVRLIGTSSSLPLRLTLTNSSSDSVFAVLVVQVGDRLESSDATPASVDSLALGLDDLPTSAIATLIVAYVNFTGATIKSIRAAAVTLSNPPYGLLLAVGLGSVVMASVASAILLDRRRKKIGTAPPR